MKLDMEAVGDDEVSSEETKCLNFKYHGSICFNLILLNSIEKYKEFQCPGKNPKIFTATKQRVRVESDKKPSRDTKLRG